MYAVGGQSFSRFDFKTNGVSKKDWNDKNKWSKEQKTAYIYRGSQIEDGVYITARDIGNFAAGYQTKYFGRDLKGQMITMGAYNQAKDFGKFTRNTMAGFLYEKWDTYKLQAITIGYPTYGEDYRSNEMIRMGYYNIRSSQAHLDNEWTIWEK